MKLHGGKNDLWEPLAPKLKHQLEISGKWATEARRVGLKLLYFNDGRTRDHPRPRGTTSQFILHSHGTMIITHSFEFEVFSKLCFKKKESLTVNQHLKRKRENTKFSI